MWWFQESNWHYRGWDVKQRLCNGIFEVLDGVTPLTIDLNEHHCDHMMWGITGMLYKHEARCILEERLNIESFVHQRTPSRTIAYKDVIMHPIKDPVFQKGRNYPKFVQPPIDIKRHKPQSERRMDVLEMVKQYISSNRLRCTKCKQYGHNSKIIERNVCWRLVEAKDTPRKKDNRQKRKVGRLRKDEQTYGASSSTQPSLRKQQAYEASSSTQPSLKKHQIRKPSLSTQPEAKDLSFIILR